MSSRILHFIPSMYGGGAERQLLYLSEALPARGWEVHVALRAGGVHLERLERSGAAVHRLGASGNYSPVLLREVAGAMKRLRPDIVQTWLTQMDVAAGLVATVKSVPWILTERSSPIDFLPPGKRRLREVVAAGAAAVVANSQAGARYWSRARPSLPRFVVPNGLPLQEIEAAEAMRLDDYRRSDDTKFVIAVGRFDEGKNFVVLVEALSIVAKRCDVVAFLCGSGPSEAHVRAAVAAAGLEDRVILPGYVEDLWSWMRAADLFVSVSHFEGLPNAVIEAAACGTALVLSDIAPHRELFGDDAAWFVDQRNVPAVAAAITAALGDDGERAARAAAAQALRRRWSVEAMAAAYDSIYSSVMEERR